jgi:hypothetical protein
MESGRYHPRHKHIEKMAAIFGVPPAIFFADGDFREYARVGERATFFCPSSVMSTRAWAFRKNPKSC